jgi:lipopolysaccharide/colanic/teichoic acid biosynthesis glycosyltransferase
MCCDAESNGPVWAEENDCRVTRFGAFIRKTRIDEIPQLWNILKGEMSFIGPRPERPYFVEQLKKKLPYYTLRHNVKPGLSGWAQVSYPYGASEEDALHKLEYDLYYIKNLCFRMDILIAIQTIKIILFQKGSR